MDALNIFGELINTTLVFSTALIFAALGGIFSERSGIVNIGLEGLMVSGAFAAAIATHFAVKAGMDGAAPWIGLVAAIIFGVAFSLIHAVATKSSAASSSTFWRPGLRYIWSKFFSKGRDKRKR